MGFFSNWLRASGYRDGSSKVLFPDETGALLRGAEKKYEAEPGQGGVAIPYHGPDAEVTVYVRRLPPKSTLSAEGALKDALAGIKELESRGQYSDVKIYLLDQSKLRTGWKAAAFTSKSEARFIVSFIYCWVRPGFLFKIRATTGNPKPAQLQSDIEVLLKAIDATEAAP